MSDPLSPRQREVALLLARGMSYKAIAKQLCISRFTVHRHVVAIGERLPGDGPTRWRIMQWFIDRMQNAA